MTLLHVVQQVLDAFGNTLAFGLNRFLLGFSVECQVVARRCSSGSLLNGKLDTSFGFGVSVSGVSERHHGACVE